MLIRTNSFFTAKGSGFRDQLNSLLSEIHQKEPGIVARMVIFGNPDCYQEFHEHLEIIHDSVNREFDKKPPTFSYITQPPLGGSCLIIETTSIVADEATQVFYKECKNTPYILAKAGNMRILFLSGIKAESSALMVSEQSDAVFSGILSVLQAENMQISSIVRQWNYIQDIVDIDDGRQNYQEFNDSRSLFYGKTVFTRGFPAATGIGTLHAGVSIDLDAIEPLDNSCQIMPVNNNLQVPAHGYSPAVLIGKPKENGKVKTTPKFERAKVILSGNKGFVYISGTAAIRGEMSTYNKGIEEQTRITIENIEHLISKNNLAAAGIDGVNNTSVNSLRVYLKNRSYYTIAKNIIDKKYPGVIAIYLVGDVCRPELLIEVEGIADFDLLK